MRVLKRRKNLSEVDSDGTWAISYGDTITLLVAFFVLFFSMTPNEDRIKRVQLSMIEKLSENPTLKVYNRKLNKEQSSFGTEENEKGFDIEKIRSMYGLIKSKDVGQKVLIDFPMLSFFPSASTDLTPKGILALQDFATKYMPFAGQFIVKVHAYADERPIKPHIFARFQDNLELAALRSISAMRILKDSGIPLNRMRVGGVGELKLTPEELLAMQENAIPLSDKPQDSARKPSSSETSETQNPDIKIKDKDEWRFARKIVLVIEPEEEKK